MIGNGFMARTHSACFVLDSRVALARIASRTASGAAEFAEEFGYGASSDAWRDVISDPEVDLVDITAPNALHAQMAVAAAEAGKHFIVEKPIATTLEDARRVADAARDGGVLGLYAENRRFAPVLLEARALLDAGKVGKPHLIRINELGSGPSHAEWFHRPESSGGGALIDLGVHGLYVLEWLMGEPVVEVAAIANFRNGTILDETTSVSYRFSSGAVAQTVSSWAAKGGIDLRTEIFGDEGTLLLDQSRTVGGIRMYRESEGTSGGSAPHQAVEWGWTYPQVEPLRTRGSLGAMRHFVDCVADGAPPQCSVDDGVRVLELAIAIYRSAREGVAVAVGDRSAVAEKAGRGL